MVVMLRQIFSLVCSVFIIIWGVILIFEWLVEFVYIVLQTLFISKEQRKGTRVWMFKNLECGSRRSVEISVPFRWKCWFLSLPSYVIFHAIFFSLEYWMNVWFLLLSLKLKACCVSELTPDVIKHFQRFTLSVLVSLPSGF